MTDVHEFVFNEKRADWDECWHMQPCSDVGNQPCGLPADDPVHGITAWKARAEQAEAERDEARKAALLEAADSEDLDHVANGFWFASWLRSRAALDGPTVEPCRHDGTNGNCAECRLAHLRAGPTPS